MFVFLRKDDVVKWSRVFAQSLSSTFSQVMKV